MEPKVKKKKKKKRSESQYNVGPLLKYSLASFFLQDCVEKDLKEQKVNALLR